MVGGQQYFTVTLSPLGTNWVFELFGTLMEEGLGGFGTRGFGQGLDNSTKIGLMV